MNDGDTPPRRRVGNDDAGPEDEPSAALSRAARDAVRQPADPRLDAQIARLGMAPESAVPARSRGRGATPEAGREAEVDRILAELASSAARVARLARHVQLLTYGLVGLGVVVAIVIIVVATDSI